MLTSRIHAFAIEVLIIISRIVPLWPKAHLALAEPQAYKKIQAPSALEATQER